MAVPDAFRPQASAWLKFLVGMDSSFVPRPVGKVRPNAGQAQLDGRTSPDLRLASGRGGADAPMLSQQIGAPVMQKSDS